MKTIFVVDDNDVNLIAAEKTLSKHYNVYTLPSAYDMFELLNDIIPDLILLDIIMPQMNGLEAMAKLKVNTRYLDIPVIFLTNKSDAETEALGFEMGAVDFVSKPFSESVLLNRIKTHLNIDDVIRDRTIKLQQKTESLQRLKNSMVSVMAEMLESRDKTTGGHIERTTEYLRLLINAMIERNVYKDELSGWDIELAVSSARLHDVGKIAVSDLILNKPSNLTKEEFEIMKIHAAEGERIIDKIISQAGDEDFLHFAKLFASYHHERWDGNGYPHGLRGEEIPLQGRIMAIVDVYDALSSERPYKPALNNEQVVNIIMESKGKQFDPMITDVFFEIKDSFVKVSSCL
ncbi:MAG: response regulator [Treponema sp.]|nr:response regulator [Treponema sp.]